MSTFAEMKTAVSERLLDPNNTSVSSANVGRAINDAIRYWKFRRFWFNQEFVSDNLTTGDTTIPLPADFLVEVPMNDGFVIEYSGMRYPLIKKNTRDYDNVYLTNGNGLPQIYTNRSGVYQVYYIPDQDYDIRIFYLKEYADLVLDADTNDFTEKATRLIELWALANLHAEFRQDEKMEQYYRAASNDEFKNLGVFTAKAQSPGYLTIHSYL